jgi:hypothetical protein
MFWLMKEAEQVYLLWHEHFRAVCVPWKELSPANRAKWTAFCRKALKIMNRSEI